MATTDDRFDWDLPDDWPEPSPSLLQRAVETALAALGEHGVGATRRLNDFYDPTGNYAGVSFAEMCPSDPYSIDVADLHAVTLLGGRRSGPKVGPLGTRRLLNDGGYRNAVQSELRNLEPTAELDDADTNTLAAMSTTYGAVMHALRKPNAKKSTPWVTAAKLCARKRPGLFPVRDTQVCELLGLLGRGMPRGDHRTDFAVFHYLLLHGDVQVAIDDLSNRVAAAGVRPDQYRLRVLDAGLWTYAVW